MITVRVTLDGPSNIPIGQQKTNGAVEVIWDISQWKKNFGEGTASLLHRRPGESVVYPCNITQQDDEVRWLVNAADTENCGVGRCWLTYMFGENPNVEKSKEYQTYIRKQPTGASADPPQVGSDWIAEAISAGNQAKEAARQAEDAVAQLDSVAQNALSQISEAQFETVGAVKAEGDKQIQRLEEIGLENLVQIDDTDISDTTAWSSEKTVDVYCPSFEVSGKVVSCNPVEGSDLNIISDSDTIFRGGLNLLKVENREQITSNEFSNTANRELNGNKLFVGITASNYFSRIKVLDYSVSNNLISVKASIAGYGLGFDFRAFPGITYYFNPSENANISFYDATGKFIKYSSVPALAPENAMWGMLCLSPSQPDVVSVWEKPILKIIDSGDYEPYNGEFFEKTLKIPALSGTNTIYANTGNVTVSGKSAPKAVIEMLTERISTLEQNAIEG